jgi:hypothetical protein
MTKIKNFEGECNFCGRHANLFAIGEDEDGYCEDCIDSIED